MKTTDVKTEITKKTGRNRKATRVGNNKMINDETSSIYFRNRIQFFIFTG